jgi:nicotinate-nucleotide--dimethylbenzimidazole phosphoribosyltransferase
MSTRIHDAVNAVRPVRRELEAEARAHLENLTKPRGSLGRLEDLAARIYCIQRGGVPDQNRNRRLLSVDPARIHTIAGDHGVVAAGVSLFPQEVTRQMVLNFCAGGAAINVLCRTAGAQLLAVDAGSRGPEYPETSGLVQRKIAPGTENVLEAPAMNTEQCAAAVELGLDLAEAAAKDGVRCVGLGEMGIGNTTPAAALYCALFGLTPEQVAGPGTGLPPEGVRRKAEIIDQALRYHAPVVASGDGLAILAALGGYEIAALAGLSIGAARHGLLLLVDGFIASAAYAVAWRLCPAVADHAFFAHASAEPGHQAALRAMGADPLLDLGMRLGEGTGAALALPLLRAAVNVFNEMATFSEAGVSDG